MTTLKFHPYSEAYRLIEGSAFDELVLDIKTNGLREKIWLYDGKILDGRNRYLACQKAKIKPLTRIYHGKDPLGFVLSMNKHRRHDSDAQLAFAGVRVATMRQGERTDLASGDARSQTKAAAEVGTSRSSLQRAKKIAEKGSKALQEAAEKGEIPLAKAAAVVDLPKSEQLAAARAPAAADPPEPADPRLREGWQPDEDDDACLAIAEKHLSASLDEIMESDEKLSAAKREIERLTKMVAVITVSRDGYLNTHGFAVRALKAEQRKTARLEREVESLKKQLAKKAA